jgi:hypothetical protein
LQTDRTDFHGFGVSDPNISIWKFAVKHFGFSFLIEHENRLNRIRVHPRNPRSISFAPVYGLWGGGGLERIKFKKI